MGKSKLRTLLVTCMTMMLCAAMIVGGTYALWTDAVTVKNHLKAGTLKVELYRTSLTKTMLNADGYLEPYVVQRETDDKVALFGSDGVTNVFGIQDGETIVPGASYEATMQIENNGAIAFSYEIVIELQQPTESEDSALASQMRVYVKFGNADYEDKGLLSQYVVGSGNGNAVITEQTMTTRGSQSFGVKIVFEDVGNDADNNNAAQNAEVSFDLSVNAAQLTQAPQSGN